MHPNGQIPAYEWNFGDVNPPVHAWSTIFTYRLEKAQTGEGDRDWLKSCFQKLLLNFTWWVNRKDRTGRNVFEGGFLGLDNIGVFDRSAAAADRRLPGAGRRHRLDGALLPEHARDRRRTGDDRSGLRGHGPQVRRTLPVDRLGDGPHGRGHRDVGRGGRLLLRRPALARRPGPAAQGSVDGRPPAACAATIFEGELLAKYPELGERLQWFLEARPEVSRRDPRPDEAGRRRPPARVDPGRNQAPPRAGQDARRERVPQPVRHPLAVALPRRSSVRHSGRRPGIPRRLPAGGVRHAACSAATPTGAARSGCRSTP